MRAVVFSHYGEASVLELRDAPRQQPTAGRVSIRVANTIRRVFATGSEVVHSSQ